MADKKEKAKLNENSRCWMYSSDAPEGRIFKGADAIAAAKKDGWKDHPSKVKADGGEGKAGDADK